MWSSSLNVDLPDGFALMEDEHNVYLFYEHKQIGVYQVTDVTPAVILQAVTDFLNQRE